MKYIIIVTIGITLFITKLFGPEMNFPANSILWWIEGFIGEIGLYTSIVTISLYSAEKYKEKRERKYGLLFFVILIICTTLSTYILVFGIDALNKLEKSLIDGEIKTLKMDVSPKSKEFQRAFSKIYATAYYTVNGDKIDYQDSTGKTLQFEPTIFDKKHRAIYKNIPALFDLKRVRMRIAGFNYAILIIVVSFLFVTRTKKTKHKIQ